MYGRSETVVNQLVLPRRGNSPARRRPKCCGKRPLSREEDWRTGLGGKVVRWPRAINMVVEAWVVASHRLQEENDKRTSNWSKFHAVLLPQVPVVRSGYDKSSAAARRRNACAAVERVPFARLFLWERQIRGRDTWSPHEEYHTSSLASSPRHHARSCCSGGTAFERAPSRDAAARVGGSE
jgi:hypothetical protein